MKKILLGPSTTSEKNWKLDRKLSVSVILEVICLASLIVGSWFNLQQNITILQRDVQSLILRQDAMNEKMQALGERAIGHEYRITAIERNSRVSPENSNERTNHYE